jgi:uncharacterized protein YeeX (DUF496 family)
MQQAYFHLSMKSQKSIKIRTLRVKEILLNLYSYLQPRITARLGRLIELPMKSAYEHQISESVIEAADPEIIATGMQMRNAVLDQYRQKYAGTSHRILFLNPPYGVGLYWFNDLAQCLNHCGITTETIEIHDVQMPEKWDAFQPTVIIGLDSPDYLRTLDLDFITQYKKEKGLLRLFTPVNSYRFPKPGLSAEDHWRLDLAKNGQSVDAYFSMMHKNFFKTFQSPWHQAGFKYLCLPFAANPFKHYPREADKIYDYFMVTSFGYERAFLTYRYTLPIFKKYHGLWAGTDWRFGMGPIPPEETPNYRAQAKIILNPLQHYNRNYAADITERAFTAAACGAFQITNISPITRNFFDQDELVCAKDPTEFVRLFEYYVTRKEERNRITMNGMQRVFREHTYFHRIDKLISFIDTL